MTSPLLFFRLLHAKVWLWYDIELLDLSTATCNHLSDTANQLNASRAQELLNKASQIKKIESQISSCRRHEEMMVMKDNDNSRPVRNEVPRQRVYSLRESCSATTETNKHRLE